MQIIKDMSNGNKGGTATALSIAGSDSGGGAGIQADLLSFAAMGVYGTTAITCLTAQNPNGVSEVLPTPAEFVRAQISQVLAYYPVKALKTGMLFDAAIIRVVCEVLEARADIRSVVDPVMVATSGSTLLQEDAVRAMCDELCPLATLITPNLDEAAVILGQRAASPDEVRRSAVMLSRKTGTAVLLKGGHLDGNSLLDVFAAEGDIVSEFTAERTHGVNSHGSGCTLSAAIAGCLARGEKLEEAIRTAHQYLQHGLHNPVRLAEAMSKTPASQCFISHERP